MPSPILRFNFVLGSAASRPTFVAAPNVANQFPCLWFLMRSFVSTVFSISWLLAGSSQSSRCCAADTASTMSPCRAGMVVTTAASLQCAAVEFKQRLVDARIPSSCCYCSRFDPLWCPFAQFSLAPPLLKTSSATMEASLYSQEQDARLRLCRY